MIHRSIWSRRPSRALLFSALVGFSTSVSAETYAISEEASSLEVHVPKAGLFSFAGHEHTIVAKRFAGSLDWDPADPKLARLELTVSVKDLAVTDESLSAKNRQKVWNNMVSEAVLNMAAQAQITFVSETIVVSSPTVWTVNGLLNVGGTVAPIAFEVQVTPADGGRIQASGVVPLALKSFEIEPVGALGGTVRTGDTVEVRFAILTQPSSQ